MRGWREAQRQGEDKVNLRISLISHSFFISETISKAYKTCLNTTLYVYVQHTIENKMNQHLNFWMWPIKKMKKNNNMMGTGISKQIYSKMVSRATYQKKNMADEIFKCTLQDDNTSSWLQTLVVSTCKINLGYWFSFQQGQCPRTPP